MELAIITTPDGGLSIKDFESIKKELAETLAQNSKSSLMVGATC